MLGFASSTQPTGASDRSQNLPVIVTCLDPTILTSTSYKPGFSFGCLSHANFKQKEFSAKSKIFSL